MLLGMALYRWGVLTGERSSALYRRLVALGVVGLAITVAGVVVYIEANDWSAGAALYWRQFIYVGSFPSPATSIVMLYARRRPDGPVTRGLAAVGRTAFTNYLLQTVIATTVFYGHGLGCSAPLPASSSSGSFSSFGWCRSFCQSCGCDLSGSVPSSGSGGRLRTGSDSRYETRSRWTKDVLASLTGVLT